MSLSDENCLNDLSILTDIAQHLSELSVILRGKSQLGNKLIEHICALENFFEQFQVQLGRATLIHFTCHAARKMEFPFLNSTNYAASAQKTTRLVHKQVSRVKKR